MSVSTSLFSWVPGTTIAVTNGNGAVSVGWPLEAINTLFHDARSRMDDLRKSYKCRHYQHDTQGNIISVGATIISMSTSTVHFAWEVKVSANRGQYL